MDEEKKEEQTIPETTAQPSDAEQALADATLQATKDDENTVSTNPEDWEAMYKELLKENEALKQQYKERFAGKDGPTQTVQQNIELADKIGSGQAESQTYEDLFNAKVNDTQQALQNTVDLVKRSFTTDPDKADETLSVNMGGAIGDDIKGIAKGFLSNDIGKNDAMDIRKQGFGGALKNAFPNVTNAASKYKAAFKDLFSDEDKEGR